MDEDIHNDLKIGSVKDEVHGFAKKHERHLQKHQNVDMLQLLDSTELVQKVHRMKPFDLVQCVKWEASQTQSNWVAFLEECAIGHSSYTM